MIPIMVITFSTQTIKKAKMAQMKTLATDSIDFRVMATGEEPSLLLGDWQWHFHHWC